MATFAKTHRSWARSFEGHSIDLHSAKEWRPNDNSRPILLIGGVHGDEPEGVEMAERCKDWLSSNPSACPWIVITCLNPDGALRLQRTNGNGVDLNRNFPAQSWSNAFQNPRYYPGPSAGSEPEIQAVVNLIKKEKPRLVIHCHSWHPCIVYTGAPALKDARRLSDASGYPLKTEIGYPTPGSLSQFGWHDHKIPVICVEAQEQSPLAEVWPRFAA